MKKQIREYGFYNQGNVETEQDLIDAIVRMSMIVATSYEEFYRNTQNKILYIDDFIKEVEKTAYVDIHEDYFLHNLLEAGKEWFEVGTYKEVFYKCKDTFNELLEEDGCTVIYTISDVFNLIEEIDGKLVLPEKWLSPDLYKKVGEFLKTFGYERTKIKKRVAYKNEGEFTNEQVIKIGKELNGVSLSTKFDFFPTPEELAEKVRKLAEIHETDTILEPSAGTGALLNGLTNKDIDCVEANDVLSSILKVKGYNVHNMLFEDFETDKKYDRIIMNPPFGKRLDAKHILKAYNLLNDGGVLVAIHSMGILVAEDKSSKAFRELYNNHGTYQEEIDAGMFKKSGKGTMIATAISKFVK